MFMGIITVAQLNGVLAGCMTMFDVIDALKRDYGL